MWGLPPDDHRYYPLLAEFGDLGIPFRTQVGHSGQLQGAEASRPFPYLGRMALEFSEIKIIGRHIGVPWLDEMISLMIKYPNVFVDTSAYKIKRYPAGLINYMNSINRHKVLFGLNHPFWPPSECLKGIGDLSLFSEVRDLFLFKNAQLIFNL